MNETFSCSSEPEHSMPWYEVARQRKFKLFLQKQKVVINMKQILLDNAYEAWRNAIHYHDQIENGISSFGNQKSFIASLHNSVELFMKQIMIDNNDYRVAWIKEAKNEEQVQMMRDYLNNSNLNDFFCNNNTKPFLSIEFNQIFDKRFKILGCIPEDRKEIFTNAMKTLKDMSNDETQFYVDSQNYLNEDDFCLMHNFMIVFYKAILDKGLFKKQLCRLHNESKDELHDFQKELAFDRVYLKTFSYVEKLRSNALAKAIAEFINNSDNNEGDNWAYNMRESLYELSWHIKWHAKMGILDNPNKIYMILKLLDDNKMIKRETDKIIDGFGNEAEYLDFIKLSILL